MATKVIISLLAVCLITPVIVIAQILPLNNLGDAERVISVLGIFGGETENDLFSWTDIWSNLGCGVEYWGKSGKSRWVFYRMNARQYYRHPRESWMSRTKKLLVRASAGLIFQRSIIEGGFYYSYADYGDFSSHYLAPWPYVRLWFLGRNPHLARFSIGFSDYDDSVITPNILDFGLGWSLGRRHQFLASFVFFLPIVVKVHYRFSLSANTSLEVRTHAGAWLIPTEGGSFESFGVSIGFRRFFSLDGNNIRKVRRKTESEVE